MRRDADGERREERRGGKREVYVERGEREMIWEEMKMKI